LKPRTASIEERNAEQAMFAALAHPTRREILLVLNFRGGAMTAGEIAERFSCRWPTVTRHLAALVRSNIVAVRRVGRSRIYQLNRRRLFTSINRWTRWFTGAEAHRIAAGR
jgi:DNA-binding transcriptional ArsR family regulator